jgi:catechol 2,3-dioxygenase-like lactoylglutathione lyase family enzyme
MSELFHLREQQLVAFIATRDPEVAKQFYRDVLGLRLVSEQLPFALVFDASGVTVRASIVQNFTPAAYTILGWDVPDIQIAVKTLEGAGVRFERYPGMSQDELGIWTSPGGAKVAWFKDPDGNTLSVSQH